jgi:predicted transcriptional regulator of viral defense system
MEKTQSVRSWIEDLPKRGRILFCADDHLLRRNASYGEINISDPIMTVLDLILYENRIGGLERVAEVIGGLIDVLEITDTSSELWRSFPIPVIQRFGYILDSILDYPELGDMLYQKTRNINIAFRRSFLDPKSKHKDKHEYLYDPKWKIVVNTDLELDQ